MVQTPSLTVIIPVYGEAAGIGQAIGHVKEQNYPGALEIVVADGEPSGAGLAAARRAHSDVAGLHTKPGRARQMNQGAAQAAGELLLFLHADTRLPPGGLALAAWALADGKAAAAAFSLGLDRPGPVWRIVEAVGNLRNRLTRTPYGDQALFIRARVFREMGGFADIPIMEDVELMRRLRRNRMPVTILRQRVRTSARRYDKEGLLFGICRNAMLRTLFALGVSARRLARFYRPHKEQP
jgi:rSAM/selenodomain-associated transferase 2